MPNRDGTGPRWAQRQSAPDTAAETSASADPQAATPPPVRPGCRGQGGAGRGLQRGRGFGCGRRRGSN